ncbi:riboflavin biosynthesis protein ribD [unidentified eubacterium SCB49]|nr:riboflavin biosynthesis protein ribD [unidentified eubacterium SCB49]
MFRCIQLAKKGLGYTYPNPLVGSVIVVDDKIIGEGWHLEAGKPHAEVNAINSVTDEKLLEKATIYVSLEPCSHFGKTPPCADLIVTKGIKNIVIGSTDPNPKVAGKGIIKLMQAGCKVKVGVLQKECDALNKRFFTFQTKKRPYIFLKWAETQDGFIAPKTRNEQAPVWITNKYARQRVHQMRAAEQAILIGTNTALADNPSLTTRDVIGSNPIRVLIDRQLKVPKTAAIFDEQAKTIVITEKSAENTETVHFECVDFNKPLAHQICEVLFKHEIESVIVEGGAQTLQTFISENLWDEAHIYKGAVSFTEGTKAPKINGTIFSETTIKSDILTVLKKDSL